MGPADDTKRRTSRKKPRKQRPGLPDEASIVAEKTFTSPKGTAYRILTTEQRDPYEQKKSGPTRRGKRTTRHRG